MEDQPRFPAFRELRLEDRGHIGPLLWEHQPETSELTFTNLFIWRAGYGWQWSRKGEHLLLLSARTGAEPYFLPPVGPSPRAGLCLEMLRWLRDERGAAEARIERADPALARELTSWPALRAEPDRNQFDYVYRTADLIALKGARYHAKRNHLSRFARSAAADYVAITGDRHLRLCAEFQDRWCQMRRCAEDLNLLGEWEAVREVLSHYPRLGLTGGAMIIGGRVEAFSVGERLNSETAVVHVEKANPEIPGLYAAINQRYCQEHWSETPSINREQDLGEPGLRKAKLSYHPARLVEKFRLRLAE